MPKIKLTATAVARLRPPPKGRADYFDSAYPAFGLRISHAGSRKYFFTTRIRDKQTRLTIGDAKITSDGPGISLAEARRIAGEWSDLIAKGIDPRQLKAAEKQQNTQRALDTFSAVADRFMRQHVEMRLAPSTHREYRRVLCGPDTKRWSDLPVTDIKRADVRALLDRIVERGSPGAANNTLAYLSKFFNWCAEKDLLETPPTDRIKKPGPKQVGERTLSETEIKEIWAAFDAEGGLFGDLFKLLLLTGQRRAEVGGMNLSELTGFDGDSPTWELPSSRTKNSLPHIVPLSPQAAEIIRQRPILGDTGLLFTYTGTTPSTGYGRAKERIDKRIAEHRQRTGQAPMPHWRLHDLRRTMITMMNEHLRILPHVVEACVNHISGGAKAGVAGVYNKALYLEERRAALAAWSVFILEITQE